MPTQQDIYDHMERGLLTLRASSLCATTEAVLVVDAASRWPNVLQDDLAPIAADVCRVEKDRRASAGGAK